MRIVHDALLSFVYIGDTYHFSSDSSNLKTQCLYEKLFLKYSLTSSMFLQIVRCFCTYSAGFLYIPTIFVQKTTIKVQFEETN